MGLHPSLMKKIEDQYLWNADATFGFCHLLAQLTVGVDPYLLLQQNA